ncbi:DUF3429 domain-containing protein [Erythrobacter sp.]|uniref:DUF3429 domain-containing protein n=1 Tax=Erythrobacter sp. TaxID=1042 RepID=UPI001425BE5E|nr:DUF3429 domain-containing protein [Erythrobacter sp.]QIQ86045.1 MAG: DUF3429 domain-containing protein [Erythrobacter sp.]
MDAHKTLTPAARWLGYAGLLPQIICLSLAMAEPGMNAGSSAGSGWGYAALPAGFAYAAAIFSFLGGVWWGQAISHSADRPAGAGAYVVAVLPSLIAVALFLPWAFGWDWPGPALLYLGAFIALSPLVDRWLGFASRDFLRLRVQLSLGLGLLTIALGLVAERLV